VREIVGLGLRSWRGVRGLCELDVFNSALFNDNSIFVPMCQPAV